MKLKDSHGYDEISTRILKMSAPYILCPLIYISNKILSTGIFPDRLKFSEVKPLYKKGILQISPITDLFHYYLPFPKQLKK